MRSKFETVLNRLRRANGCGIKTLRAFRQSRMFKIVISPVGKLSLITNTTEILTRLI
jgi:hypothetical protein